MKQLESVCGFLESANKNGIVTALYGTFGKCIKVSIPFSRKACDTSIDEIDFSVRAGNSLKRAGVFSVGEVIDLIAEDKLSHIRNLGKKTENEIKTRILAFGYERLSENEKRRLFFDIAKEN